MAVNRGKQFEQIIEQSFRKVPGVSIDRLHDQTTGYKGSSNICDFIVYKEPYEYYIECKSVHGNTLSIYSNDPKHKYGNITNTQWEKLIEKAKIEGVHAGIICWWIDRDETWYIPIWVLYDARVVCDDKSININHPHIIANWTRISGKKKRVFFDYDMTTFFRNVKNEHSLDIEKLERIEREKYEHI